MKLIGRIGPQSSVSTDHLIVYLESRAVLRKGMSIAFGVTDDGKMMRAGWARVRDCIGFDQKSLLLERPANIACPAVASGDFIYDPETPLREERDVSLVDVLDTIDRWIHQERAISHFTTSYIVAGGEVTLSFRRPSQRQGDSSE